MTEPTVQVPVSLIERIVDGVGPTRTRAFDELRALLSQPTPTAEPEVDACYNCHGAGYHDGGDMRDDEPCYACGGTGIDNAPADPPRIEDMAPGAVVLDTYAAVCIRDDLGWLRVTPSVSGGQHRHRPFGLQLVLFDPSTIRDMTPPTESTK